MRKFEEFNWIFFFALQKFLFHFAALARKQQTKNLQIFRMRIFSKWNPWNNRKKISFFSFLFAIFHGSLHLISTQWFRSWKIMKKNMFELFLIRKKNYVRDHNWFNSTHKRSFQSHTMEKSTSSLTPHTLELIRNNLLVKLFTLHKLDVVWIFSNFPIVFAKIFIFHDNLQVQQWKLPKLPRTCQCDDCKFS